MPTFSKMLRKTVLIVVLGCAHIQAAKIECVAGCGEGPLGGPAKGAKLIEPFGVDFDQQGNWYICQYKGQKVSKVDPRGIITLFAGTGEKTYGGDGGPAQYAELNDPHSLYIKDKHMYVADTRNHRVRKIDLKTGIITTIAGTGEAGYSGDGGPANQARFNGTFDLALDAAGEKLYVADLNNRRVRLVDLKSGDVTTVAGNGTQGVPKDGANAVRSPLVDPRAVTLDSSGNLYILSRRGNALRLVDKKGKIRTVIGPGDIRPDMNGPKHLCLDLQGNIIIADSENHLIRRYSPKGGKVVTIAGTGEKGNRLVADDPLKTQLNRPHGVYVHPSGALYISDSNNHRVLKMTSWQ
ncbi:hypothetical protein MYX84_03345 [Acidobacteria bacterium AH-259-O06]|nr:hypothetical protein [Acidobacteria bacterium AH-259-O06]